VQITTQLIIRHGQWSAAHLELDGAWPAEAALALLLLLLQLLQLRLLLLLLLLLLLQLL
jgi:hypothetical protein